MSYMVHLPDYVCPHCNKKLGIKLLLCDHNDGNTTPNACYYLVCENLECSHGPTLIKSLEE